MYLGKEPPKQKPVVEPDDPKRLAEIRAMPCCICEEWGYTQESPTEAHHCIMGRNSYDRISKTRRRAPDSMAIPLCNGHHTGDMDKSKISVHRHRAQWLEEYGNDTDWISWVDERLLLGRIREQLSYDPETGVFRWLVSRPGVAAGSEAGTFTSEGYRQIALDRRSFRAHRIAFVLMTGQWPENEVDHVNGDRADNRWTNLRDVTCAENHRNRAIPANNTSGHMGVSFQDGTWRASIFCDGQYINLGRFANKADAIAARTDAEREYGFHENHGRAL